MRSGKSLKECLKNLFIDKALTIALENKGLKIESQKRIDIYFQGQKVGTYVPDKVVNDIILLELKTKPFIIKQDIEQFWKYLKGSEYKLGFLINFSPKNLQIKRVVYDTARAEKSSSASSQRNNQRPISG